MSSGQQRTSPLPIRAFISMAENKTKSTSGLSVPIASERDGFLSSIYQELALCVRGHVSKSPLSHLEG